MDLLQLLSRHGLALVAGSVLLEQGGLPVPAAPILVGAGALAQEGAMRPELVLLSAFAACLIADHTWFWLGRWRGRRLLAIVCRLSLSPDTCVRKTDDLIARHGAPLLLVAKFIPGVSAAVGMAYARFTAFDAVGCVLWSGAYIGAGMIFSRELSRVFATMGMIGGWALVALPSLLALYILLKVAHRARLKRLYRTVRISPHEFAALVRDEPELVVVDARSRLAYDQDPRRLPRSIRWGNDDDIHALLPPNARDNTVVTFCTCPNEASAALLADQLIKAGYSRVRVLTGGEETLSLLAMDYAAAAMRA